MSSARHTSRLVTTVAFAALLAACGGSDDDAEETIATDPAAASDAGDDGAASDGDVGSDAGDDGAASDGDVGSDAGDDGATPSDGGDAPGEASGEGADTAGDPVTAPEVDAGTVVLDGTAYELTGPSRSDVLIESGGTPEPSDREFDFEICETVNPAFAGTFNIAGTLGDGTPFRLSGTVGEAFGAVDGLWLGDVFEEEQAADLEVSLDGRTLTGAATTSRGDIEFSFTC